MQPIRILTTSFHLLGEIDDYESLQFTRCSKKVGEFELHIHINKQFTDYLIEDNLIVLSPKKVGVIRYREVSRDDSEQIVVKGYSLQGLLSRRITIPPEGKAYDSISGPLETVMKHYIQTNAVSPTDSTRAIPQLIIAPDLGRGPVISHDSRFAQLDEEIVALSTDTIGWEIYLDSEQNRFVFDIIEGKNLISEQTEYPPVIFSIEFDNIKNQTFTDSATSYKNTAYVAGQGEGENRSIAEVGVNASGLDRIETFVDARDIENESDLAARGQVQLAELSKVVSFESEILTYGPFIYESDWDLGDTVTIRDSKLGIVMNTPIPQVREIYESSGFSLEATFGNTIPTLIEKIKQVTKTPMLESAPIPTKTSDLENDAGYVTEDEVSVLVSDKSYIHNQLSPTNLWTIVHNLNKYPSVNVVDSGGNTVVGNIKYESINKVTISFSSTFAGKAYFN